MDQIRILLSSVLAWLVILCGLSIIAVSIFDAVGETQLSKEIDLEGNFWRHCISQIGIATPQSILVDPSWRRYGKYIKREESGKITYQLPDVDALGDVSSVSGKFYFDRTGKLDHITVSADDEYDGI